MQSLHARGLTTICCVDPFEALERLCEGPASKPKKIGEGAALVIVEPRRSRRARQLAEAARRYAPAAPVWRYESDASPRLAAFDLSPSGKDLVGIPAAKSTGGAPALKLAGGEPEPVRRDDERPTTSREILTEDELAMLLADDLGEGPGTTRGATR